jgi:hypothetical protein
VVLRRRQANFSLPFAIAAEVLEVRALLSAGAVSTHIAQRHAADTFANMNKHAIADITLGTNTLPIAMGILSMPTVKAQDGAKVTAHFSFSEPSGAATLSFKGTFQGKITSSTTQAGATKITINPTGGSIVMSEKATGIKTVKVKAIPDGSSLELDLDASLGAVLRLQGTDVFPPGAPFNGETITMLIF